MSDIRLSPINDKTIWTGLSLENDRS
ncbi:uncharacterized protein METZ01_LOCUS256619, partial [marine metagenome]